MHVDTTGYPDLPTFLPVTSLCMRPIGDGDDCAAHADFISQRDANLNHLLVFAIQSETHSKPLHINTPGRLLQACFIRAWRRANVERVASS